jgi:tetratricopeptide (TPR) repeat protein
MLDRFRAQGARTDAMERARAALSRGQLPEAIAAYRQVLELEDNTLVQQELNRLEARLAVRQGTELRDAGQLEEAAGLFQVALTKDPENQDALRYRRELVSVSEVQSLLQAGDASAAAGDYEAAVRQYRQALEIDALDVVKQKLDDATRNLAMQSAETALSEGRFDDAERQADRAAEIDPDHASIAAFRERLSKRRAYQAKLDAAEAQRAQGNLRLTLRRLQEAREILDTPAVDQRIEATQYAWAVAKARQHLANGLLGPAEAELEIAARIDATEEVTDLRARLQAERSRPAETGS